MRSQSWVFLMGDDGWKWFPPSIRPLFCALKTHFFFHCKGCGSVRHLYRNFPQCLLTLKHHSPIHHLSTTGWNSSLWACGHAECWVEFHPASLSEGWIYRLTSVGNPNTEIKRSHGRPIFLNGKGHPHYLVVFILKLDLGIANPETVHNIRISQAHRKHCSPGCLSNFRAIRRSLTYISRDMVVKRKRMIRLVEDSTSDWRYF